MKIAIFLSILRMLAASKAIGHFAKLAFCDFFKSATSCNSLDYRKLQDRIFKVTSKNLSFLPSSMTATEFDKRIISKGDSKIDFRVPMQSV